jgi:hypothetical protein
MSAKKHPVRPAYIKQIIDTDLHASKMHMDAARSRVRQAAKSQTGHSYSETAKAFLSRLKEMDNHLARLSAEFDEFIKHNSEF